MGRLDGPIRDEPKPPQEGEPSLTTLVLGRAWWWAGFTLVYRLGGLLLPGESWASAWSSAGLALTSAAALAAGSLAFFGSSRGLIPAKALPFLPFATAPMALDLAKRGNSPAVVTLTCAGMGLFYGLATRAGVFLPDLGRRGLRWLRT